MPEPSMQKDLRELPRQEQFHGARKSFGELAARQTIEFLFSAPLYGFCISLLEGGQKFSWKRLDERTWQVTATKAPYPSLNSVTGAHHPAALPGDILCVTDRKEKVWLIDARRSQVVADIVLGGGPSHLAAHPEGHLLYVACPGAEEVAVVDVGKRERVTAIRVGKGGQLPNFSPDGRLAVIDCSQTHDVYLMDAERHRVIFSQSVGEGPHEALFTPDGRLVCVPCASGDLYLVPPENPDRFTVLRCGFGAGHVDFSSDGRYAYVANSLDDDVAIVDLVVKEVVARVPAGAGAHRPTLSEDGRLLFVANFVADTVTVIDTRSREVTGTVPVGTYPHDAVRAPGGRIAVCSYGSGSATVIDPARGLAKTELETGQGTSHCGFLCGGALGLFANSISQDVTIVDMEKTTPRATIAVSARATRVDQL